MRRSLRTLLLLAGLVPALALAASWWNNDWKFRKEITFDLTAAGADIAVSPQDVPVLLRLSLANFSYFNDTKPDGSDFRLVGGDDKTPLKYHFEKYDAQNEMALLWVRVPQITGGSKTDKIYAYYGNPDAPAGADVAGTYDTATALVLSFGETTGLPLDATAYKNNASTSTAVPNPASLIGGGVRFSGKESITVPASASLRLLPNQGLTVSAWLKAEQQQAVVFALVDQGRSIEVDLDGARLVARATLEGPAVTVTQPGELSGGQWHHVALSIGSGKMILYVDGLAAGSAPVTVAEVGGMLTIGAMNGSRFLAGDLDEFAVSKVARSADWIKAAARSQGVDANLVIYGTDGQREGGSQTSYFGTIARNLTLDGWVVIGICMGMLVIAIVVMVIKAIFLSRVEAANARFLKDYRQLANDPTALDSASDDSEDLLENVPSMTALTQDTTKYGASTLYRLYHHGVQELHKRVNGKGKAGQSPKTLSPQSIDAIRAAMDATMTRLQQSLSAQMVLLTIAISGGPFLGLLGTVIGVMITFAAIALSGDVNVNAIAPGTAAALAATVAGLSVAIPSLFGYNWLNTRIKSVTADHRVFVDEFVTRLAEQYS